MNVISSLCTKTSWPKYPQTETAWPKCPVTETAQTETTQTETAQTETARPKSPLPFFSSDCWAAIVSLTEHGTKFKPKFSSWLSIVFGTDTNWQWNPTLAQVRIALNQLNRTSSQTVNPQLGLTCQQRKTGPQYTAQHFETKKMILASIVDRTKQRI